MEIHRACSLFDDENIFRFDWCVQFEQVKKTETINWDK